MPLCPWAALEYTIWYELLVRDNPEDVNSHPSPRPTKRFDFEYLGLL